MLNKLAQLIEKHQGSHDIIDKWLNHRQTVLTQYFELLKPCSKEAKLNSVESALKAFSAELVDYASEGHFEVYENLINPLLKAKPDLSSYVNSLLETISVSTDAIVEFNDKYSAITDDDFINLDKHLATIGVILEDRFEAEDMLIEVLSKTEA